MIISNLGFLQSLGFFGRSLDMNKGGSVLLDTGQALSSQFTISFWANFHPSDITNRLFLRRNTPTTYVGAVVAAGTDSIILLTESSSEIGFDFTIPESTRVHFMIARDGSDDIRAYMNGTESTTGAINDSNALYIDYLSNDFNALADELCIWGGVTGTGTNAVSLYNSGEGIEASSVIASPTLYYKFNESGTQTEAIDESTNNNDGTLSGFPASGMWKIF